jgi:hypothetical protein
MMETLMTYSLKPLGCDPARIKGMSERLIVSHYENNYGGAVKRLNLIEEKLAELDYANAPGFLLNGLKREELIAMNSMILHELFFRWTGRAERARRRSQESDSARFRIIRALALGVRRNGQGARWRAPGGCYFPGPRATASSSINGHRTTATQW